MLPYKACVRYASALELRNLTVGLTVWSRGSTIGAGGESGLPNGIRKLLRYVPNTAYSRHVLHGLATLCKNNQSS